mmetsp:Transcript_5715/g.10245  ORF Transcript_5715/g.10245 Transcript_5715/m.10245 type:complete len:179 (-) Transcript_5715:36-572(-)
MASSRSLVGFVPVASPCTTPNTLPFDHIRTLPGNMAAMIATKRVAQFLWGQGTVVTCSAAKTTHSFPFSRHVMSSTSTSRNPSSSFSSDSKQPPQPQEAHRDAEVFHQVVVPDEEEVEKVLEQIYGVPHHVMNVQECPADEGIEKCWQKMETLPLEEERKLAKSDSSSGSESDSGKSN